MDDLNIQFGDYGILSVPRQFGHYTYVRTIGHGSFSAVLLAKCNKTQELYACKAVSRKMLVEMQIFDRFEQEARILNVLKHPNIVQLIDVVYQEEFIFLVMEYCRNGELFSYIVTRGFLTDREINRIFRQIVSSVSYLHSKQIVHRDIKPENILLDASLNPKLADFGLCRSIKRNALLETPCGSPYYAPPEIIENIEYDGKKSDIWSLGVVLFTMATGTLPWTESNQTQLFIQIRSADIAIPLTLSPPLQQILHLMLQKDPHHRPTADEVLEMPWLSDDSFSFIKPSPLKRASFSGVERSSPESRNSRSAPFKRSLIIRPNIEFDQDKLKISPNVQIRKAPYPIPKGIKIL